MALPQEAPVHDPTVTDSDGSDVATEPKPRTPNYALRRAIAIGATVFMLTGVAEGVKAITARHNAPAPIDRSNPVNYKIRPGDTPWGIAEQYNTGGDVRNLVDDIADQTGGGHLQAGTDITVPGPHPDER